jgi:hypothetical protein
MTYIVAGLNWCLGAGFIFAGAGIHCDLIIYFAEFCEFYFCTVTQFSHFHHITVSVATGRTFGISNLTDDHGRQVDRNKLAVKENRIADISHTINNIGQIALYIVFVDFVVIALFVHKHIGELHGIGVT